MGAAQPVLLEAAVAVLTLGAAALLDINRLGVVEEERADRIEIGRDRRREEQRLHRRRQRAGDGRQVLAVAIRKEQVGLVDNEEVDRLAEIERRRGGELLEARRRRDERVGRRRAADRRRVGGVASCTTRTPAAPAWPSSLRRTPWTCWQSSRVGTRTTAPTPGASDDAPASWRRSNCCSSGRAYAIVLPEPVGAREHVAAGERERNAGGLHGGRRVEV